MYGGAIVAPQYAKVAHLKVGDMLTIPGSAGTVRARVVGELRTMADTYGGMMMQVSLRTMDAVYGPSDDVALAVKARSPADVQPLQAATQRLLDRRYPNVELLSSSEIRERIDQEVSQQFGLFNAIIGIAVIVSLLGVINTLAMSVLERTREIGVLRALGSSRWLVRAGLLNESLMITFSGAVVGVLSGLAIGVTWVAGLGDVMPGLRFRFPVGATLTVAVIAIVLGALAAVLPARRAARVDVIRALTYE